MYKIIGGDKREYGPVDAEEVRRWIAEGRLNAQSLAQAEGETEWKPLSSFPEFAATLRAQSGPAPIPEGLVTPADIGAWTERILGRTPEVEIGRCLARSWSLLKGNLGLLMGATLIFWLISLCQFIPLVGFLYLVFAGVLCGGLYLVFLKRIRGQPAVVQDVFAGFSGPFGQLLLAGFISYLLGMIGVACCCVIPGVYLLVAWVFSVPLVMDKRLEFWSAMELSRKVVTRVWFEILGLLLVAFLPVILAIIFTSIKGSLIALPSIWETVRSGQPDPGRIMQLVGQLSKHQFAMAVGIKLVVLLNLPFAVGALMYAYEDLFGARTTPNA
jgi:hypothetical protein